MKKFIGFSMVLALLTLVPIPVQTQASVTQTTLSAAVTNTTRVVRVASATGFAVGNFVYIDREAATVTAVAGTNVTLNRGTFGTAAAAHASGSVVFTGPPNYLSSAEPAGACTSTSEVALPRIVPAPGKIFDCKNSRWTLWQDSGFPTFGVALLSGNSYTASGAVTVQPGVHLIAVAGVGAMTIVDPTLAQNGMILIIEASTANAHTLTYTAGFNGGTTARDVATFGGAIGDNIVIFANNGVWWVISTRNVTLA